MPICVACSKRCELKKVHQFTAKKELRDLWLTALTEDDSTKERLEHYLNTTSGRHFVCIDHFSDDSYNETLTTRVLKPNAIPVSKRSASSYDDHTVNYSNPTVPFSPPPTPSFPLLSSTPVARPVVDRPSFRLADEKIPPCCRCCCKKETATELKSDPNWKPRPPTITDLPDSDYFIVSRSSLVQLLTRCNSCPSGQNNLSFKEKAHALSCKCKCTSCGDEFKWYNSDLLPTANPSKKENLTKINVDICVGSAVTAVGTAKLNQFMKAVGLNTVTNRTFHRLKNEYLLPATTQVYNQLQEKVYARLMDRLSKGEKLHIAGDGSFDTRGYSAEWCRYILVDAITGEALVSILMNKKETGSSGKLEVKCLEKALDELAGKIGGVQNIATLVTDRHSGAMKMVRENYPSIRHYYDPWHFFRNLTLNLMKIVKPDYMEQVRETWMRIFINKAYDSVVRAAGNGVMASEMFRSSLLCCTGVHDFSGDPSFTQFKKCLHPLPDDDFPYIEKDGRAYKRLESVIFTDKNIHDIMSVSWLLKTSTCESLNALAWRYAPKDHYYDRKGHTLRSMFALMHWNELKKDEADGKRTITGQKSYYNHTLKKSVARNVKTPAKNAWRVLVKEKSYEVRASLTSTPYSLAKKTRLDNQTLWNTANTPTIPHWADTNLDESEDEEELIPSHLDDERIDEIFEESRLVLEQADRLDALEKEADMICDTDIPHL